VLGRAHEELGFFGADEEHAAREGDQHPALRRSAMLPGASGIGRMRTFSPS